MQSIFVQIVFSTSGLHPSNRIVWILFELLKVLYVYPIYFFFMFESMYIIGLLEQALTIFVVVQKRSRPKIPKRNPKGCTLYATNNGHGYFNHHLQKTIWVSEPCGYHICKLCSAPSSSSQRKSYTKHSDTSSQRKSYTEHAGFRGTRFVLQRWPNMKFGTEVPSACQMKFLACSHHLQRCVHWWNRPNRCNFYWSSTTVFSDHWNK